MKPSRIASAAITVLLSVLTFTSTVAGQETPFPIATEAFSRLDTGLVPYIEEMVDSGWDMLAVQEYEYQLAAALDEWQSLVISSCYEGWHRHATIYFETLIALQRHWRLGDEEGYNAIAGSIEGMGYLRYDALQEAIKECDEVSDSGQQDIR